MLLDKDGVHVLREETIRALADIEKKYGFKVTVGSISYDPNGKYATINKIHVATIGDDGKVQTKESERFKDICILYNLKPEHQGTKIIIRGEAFIIEGINRRRPQFPMLLKRVADGKQYKASAEDVQRALGLEVKPTFRFRRRSRHES